MSWWPFRLEPFATLPVEPIPERGPIERDPEYEWLEPLPIPSRPKYRGIQCGLCGRKLRHGAMGDLCNQMRCPTPLRNGLLP